MSKYRTIRERFSALGEEFLTSLERAGVPLDVTPRQLTPGQHEAVIDAFERILDPKEFMTVVGAALRRYLPSPKAVPTVGPPSGASGMGAMFEAIRTRTLDSWIFGRWRQKQERALSRYLRLHEGWSHQKARAETRRIFGIQNAVDAIVDAAEESERDAKSLGREVDRALETPEEQDRRARMAALVDRFESAVDRARPLSKGEHRVASDLRRYSQTVHTPTENRIARFTEKVEQEERYFEQRRAAQGEVPPRA